MKNKKELVRKLTELKTIIIRLNEPVGYLELTTRLLIINEALEDLEQERGLSNEYKVGDILEAYYGRDHSDKLEEYNESTG